MVILKCSIVSLLRFEIDVSNFLRSYSGILRGGGAAAGVWGGAEGRVLPNAIQQAGAAQMY